MPAADHTIKHCPKCDRSLHVTAFHQDRSRVDGLRGHCKECSRASVKARGEEIKNRGTYVHVTSKSCPRCHQDKPAADFYRDDRKPDGRYGLCRLCAARAQRER